MNITNENITLRAIEKEDYLLLKELINDPDIESMVVGWSFPVSTEQQMNWIDNQANDNKNVRFIIDINSIGAVGLISLSGIDYKNRTATMNIKLNKEDRIRKKGIGYKTVNMVIEYAFDQLNMNCLTANILQYNIASKRLFEKCGFELEGTLRSRVYKNGDYHDLLTYSLLRGDYNERDR